MDKLWDVPISGAFLDSLSSSKKSAYRLYSIVLDKYARWLRRVHKIEKNYDELTLEDLKPSWVESFLSRYGNSYTFNSYLSAFRSLAKYAQKEFIPRTIEEFTYLHRFVNGLSLISVMETPKYFSKEALTEEELERLLEVVSEDDLMYPATVVHFYFGARPVELARKYVEATINLDRIGEIVEEHGRAVVDFDSKIVCMPIAKSKTRVKVLPFDFIYDYFRTWFENLDEITRYGNNRSNEWYTKRIKKYARRIGLKITAKTARKTFETLMRRRGVEQWIVDYWLGHRTQVPDIYTDYNVLLPEIRKVIREKHYILDMVY